MLTSEQIRAVIERETADLRQFRSQPPILSLDKLLEALAQDHLHALTTVSSDDLRYRQGALAQIQALRRCIHSARDSPRI